MRASVMCLTPAIRPVDTHPFAVPSAARGPIEQCFAVAYSPVNSASGKGGGTVLDFVITTLYESPPLFALSRAQWCMLRL